MADWPTWTNTVVAVVALVVSVIAVWLSHRAQVQANAAQKRIVEIEERREQDRIRESTRAVLRPELRETDRGFHRLYLVNHGGSEARNIRVKMDGQPLDEHKAAVHGSPMPAFVGPQSEIGCILAFHSNCVPPFEFEVLWDDDSGTNWTYRTTLTF